MNIKTIFTILIITLIVQAIQIKNRKFYDEDGKEIIFRGPNVVVKVPPYMPQTSSFNAFTSFSQQDMRKCKSWGFNAIRLGVMWAGVQPSKDTYNETYLAEMLKLVNLAGSYGIYTLIDFHQDIIAEKYCGDGIPTWLIDQVNGYRNFPYPIDKKFTLNATGLPDWQDCLKHDWPRYYFSLDVGKTFNDLYTKGHRLNDKFNKFWRKIAETFAGNKFLIGYELINQPFVGKALQRPYLIIPSVAERVHFQNFYDRVAQQIRKVDTSTPICFEPVTFDNSVPIGFSHPPGGHRYDNLSILCYHHYQPPALSLSNIDSRLKDAKRLNIPSLLSQFYAAGKGSAPVIAKAQTYQQSWLFWNYKSFGKNWGGNQEYKSSTNPKFGSGIYDDNGNPNPQQISTLSTTFFPKVAGKLQYSIYDDITKRYYGRYEAQPGGKSILYLNKQYNYPNGFNIEIHPVGKVSYTDHDGYLELIFSGFTSELVSVTITRN